jgi:uncharacterized membrane protein (DUF2068 family)
MEIDKLASLEGVDAGEQEAPLKRAPTLYLIILFKLAKGVLAVFLALFLYCQPATHLPAEYEQLMDRPSVKQVFHYLRIHPENKFFMHLTRQIANATDKEVRVAVKVAVIGALLWSLFPLTEGVGLMFRVKWAGWLAIVESAFFVPVEIYELVKEFSWFMVGVAIINIGIVWYLYANRERLFHHHLRHRPHHSQA